MGARRGLALGAARASDGELRPASPWRSRIVHAAWWPSALPWNRGPAEAGKSSALSDNAPSFYARQPEFYAVRPFVDKWIVRSRQAAAQFVTLRNRGGVGSLLRRPKTFFRLTPQDADLQALRRQLGLPEDAYVIGKLSFRHGIHAWT